MGEAAELDGRRVGGMRRAVRVVVRGAFPSSTTKQFLGKEWTSPLRVGVRKRLPLFVRLWRQGFLSDANYIYELKTRRSDYLSDFGRLQTRKINGPYAEILNNKIAFAAVVGKRLRTPANLGVILKGRVLAVDGAADVAAQTVWMKRDVAIKPIASGSGKGVHILRWTGGKPVLDGRETDDESVAKFMQRLDGCIITEFVQQSDYSAVFHPPTTNTIRILTMISPETGKPFVAIAVQRMGSSRSMPVDNWSRGGVCAEIDLETGELGAGASFPVDGRLQWHDVHPETRSQIKGVHVPGWASIRDSILETAAALPYLQYVGWDVVVGRDGIWVLEGNNFSDVNLLQVHRPLLADPRVRAFYEHHGIIK